MTRTSTGASAAARLGRTCVAVGVGRRCKTHTHVVPGRSWVCRHVILPKELAKLIPKGKLLSEPEWRAYGVQQSRGWEHYAIHKPEPHILLFRRLLGTDPVSGKVVPALRDAAVEAYHKEFEIGAGGAGTAAAGAAGKKA